MTEAISVAAAVLSLIVGLVSFVGIVIAMVLGGLEGRRKKLEDEVEKQKHKKSVFTSLSEKTSIRTE